MVDGSGARIDQVAAVVLKNREKTLIGDPRIYLPESIADGAIQSRVLLVEEPPGCGRRFADEEKPNL